MHGLLAQRWCIVIGPQAADVGGRPLTKAGNQDATKSCEILLMSFDVDSVQVKLESNKAWPTFLEL